MANAIAERDVGGHVCRLAKATGGMNSHWPGRRVLVTGGTGFLGFHLCRSLSAKGARVRSLALPAPEHHPIRSLPIEIRDGDIRDAAAVRRATANCDVIFHAAGNVAVWGPGLRAMHDIHVHGTRNIVQAAGQSIPVIHTSSITAVGATRRGDVLDEESEFALQNLRVDYVHAKRQAEIIARDAGAIVVNPGYLIGPDDHEPSVMGKFCDRVWKGKMGLAAPGGYNLVDVRDVAAGHLQAAERGQPGRRYILGGTNLDLRDFMRLLLREANLSPRWLPRLPMAAMWLAAGLAELRAWKTRREPYPSFQHVRLNGYRWFVTSQRAQAELGYMPRDIGTTIKEMYAWYIGQRVVHWRGLTRWWLRPQQAA
jgi:dihydroflavonol-4-reductase